MKPPPDGDTQAYLYLTHRPAEGVTNELNLVAGFNFAPDQPATLTVGGKSFDLFTQKDAAWLLDAADGDSIVYGGYSAGACVLTPTLKGIHLADEPDLTPAGYESMPVIWEGWACPWTSPISSTCAATASPSAIRSALKRATS